MIPPLKAIGRILGKHGYRGELNIELNYIGAGKGLKKGNFLFVEFDNKGVPFYIESVSASGRIVKLRDINTEENAQELAGRLIILEEKLVPKSTKSNYNELKGYCILDSNSDFSGLITAVEEYPQGLMFLVEMDGAQLLIPAVDSWIVAIDERKKVISMNFPEGLAEI